MNTNKHIITVNDIEVRVVRKDIKNLHLAVYPPDGRVRVAAPQHVTDDNVRLAVISKLRWIKQQKAVFAAQDRQSRRTMVSGESHYLFGKRYLLEVVERRGRHEVVIKNNTTLTLYVTPDTTEHNRLAVINEWYRLALKERIAVLLDKWQPVVGESVSTWGVKKMKTKWGSCNIAARRIWLNLELAKKPVECLEYVLVHEMAHLLERHHNENFKALMDDFLPQWWLHRDTLNSAPLGHDDWGY